MTNFTDTRTGIAGLAKAAHARLRVVACPDLVIGMGTSRAVNPHSLAERWKV